MEEDRKKKAFCFACLGVNQDSVLIWVKFVTTPRQELPCIHTYMHKLYLSALVFSFTINCGHSDLICI